MFYSYRCGQKQPNELGIYDMSGNVAEWCSDWYGPYSSNAQTNPQGPSSGNGNGRVVRGGHVSSSNSSSTAPVSLRVAARSSRGYSIRSKEVGFRIVCSAE